MESFVAQFLLPVLGCVTALFIFVGFKALRMSVAQKEHEEKAATRFTYAQQAFEGIGTSIKELHSEVEQSLMPRVDEMYRQLLTSGREINATTLPDILKAISLEKSCPVSRDGSVVFAGVEHENLKISFFFSLQSQGKDLVINSFAFCASSLSPDILLRLLMINSANKMATIGIHTVAGKLIIFVDHVLCTPNGRIDIEPLDTAVMRIVMAHKEVADYLQSVSCPPHELLASEYMDLIESTKASAPAETPSCIDSCRTTDAGRK